MRLTHEQVQTSIGEMWAALAEVPADIEDKQEVIDRARQIEAKLRLRLAAQDRLDKAAPSLLQAARELDLWWHSGPDISEKGPPESAMRTIELAIRIADGTPAPPAPGHK